MTGLSFVSYVGGKGTHLDALLPLIPYTHTYVEPYGGAASILLNRRPSPVEVYNDLNHTMVNLFRVVSDPHTFDAFERRCQLTFYSRSEFITAVAVINEYMSGTIVTPVDLAWATYVVQNQGISGKLHRSDGNWSRSKETSVNTRRWWSKVDRLVEVLDRMERVQIDEQDALTCISYWDSPQTTFYLDPPYVLETRAGRLYYGVEQQDEHHQQLVDLLLTVQGAVVLSGYDHELYSRLEEHGWVCHEYGMAALTTITTDGDTKPTRVEKVWMNPQAIAGGAQSPLF